jgi:pimeloyl-ACP methyl ester carboxylesterase
MAGDVEQRRRRQAVLVIHGMGEPKPMETLRTFVEAIWTRRSDGTVDRKKKSWLRPDEISDSFDLRQIVTREEGSDVTTDFFELYWAHLMTGNRIASVWSWIIFDLLLRPNRTMPPPMRQGKWIAVPLAILVLLVGCLLSSIVFRVEQGPLLLAAEVLAVLVLIVLNALFLGPFVGDAARYFRSRPENIRARQDIRALGVRILNDLHDKGRRYDRIILVGHSLGSVIGYDILTYAFARRCKRIRIAGAEPPEEIKSFDEIARDAKLTFNTLQAAQRRLAEAEWAREAWRVTDFVTMGCPLTYAHVLMANGKHDFDRRVAEREFPRCPPQRDRKAQNEQGMRGFYRFADDEGGAAIKPHHAAVFAFTRWVNLYFPARRVVFGDLVGGPVRPLFGEGIKDVSMDCMHLWGRRIFSHTSYWTSQGLIGLPDHLDCLRRAIDLGDANLAATLPESTSC